MVQGGPDTDLRAVADLPIGHGWATALPKLDATCQCQTPLPALNFVVRTKKTW